MKNKVIGTAMVGLFGMIFLTGCIFYELSESMCNTGATENRQVYDSSYEYDPYYYLEPDC